MSADAYIMHHKSITGTQGKEIYYNRRLQRASFFQKTVPEGCLSMLGSSYRHRVVKAGWMHTQSLDIFLAFRNFPRVLCLLLVNDTYLDKKMHGSNLVYHHHMATPCSHEPLFLSLGFMAVTLWHLESVLHFQTQCLTSLCPSPHPQVPTLRHFSTRHEPLSLKVRLSHN